MNKDNYSEQLEYLLKNKDADKLNADENQLVIRVLGSIEAFIRLRSIAARSQVVLSNERITPSESVLQHILANTQMRAIPLPKRQSWFLTPLPIYKVAATAILTMGLTWWWAQSRMALPSEPIIITLVDTVYQEVVRVDTFRMDPAPMLKRTVVHPQEERPLMARKTLTHTTRTNAPDFRFSMDEFPAISSNRTGKIYRDYPEIQALDSMQSIDLFFAADRVL